jgi:hypothetical protein
MKGDFFTRLAERTLGLAPLVKPDLMPAIAATPESMAIGDSFPSPEETQGRTSAAKRVPPRQRGDSPPLDRDETAVRRLTPASPFTPAPGLPAAVGLSSPGGDPLDRGGETGEQASDNAAFRQGLPVDKVGEIERQSVRREITTRKNISLGEVTERMYASPAATRSESSRGVNPPASSIQISIGTVEVRAVLPPVPAPRAQERQAPARLSLEQYLRERNERRR